MKKNLSISSCLLLLILISCRVSNEQNAELRTFKDALGREVKIPERIDRIIALRAGALRLITYMECSHKIVAVEGNEKRRKVPYLMAHPALAKLPTIGNGNTFDTELLLKNHPDIIFITYTNKDIADELQQKTGIPVFALNYGNLSSELPDFYETILTLGEILNKESRADSLISYVKNSIEDLDQRSKKANQDITAYIGGVAYSGSHGLSSTVPHYPPFQFLNAKNVAEEIPFDNTKGTFIDIEQLLKWNPDKIFIDASGEQLIRMEIEKGKIPVEHLKAFKNKDIYRTWPYNWYTLNYENVLIDAYYIGKTLYPESFSDIDPDHKADDIYIFFLGQSVRKQMTEKFGQQGLW